MTTLIVPGLGGSGDGHWQRWWTTVDPGAKIVEQPDWSQPDLPTWTARVAEEVSRHPVPLLVGHSLGAVLIAHLAAQRPDLTIRGALLVAPADVEESETLRAAAPGFSPIPRIRLPFPCTVVASTNDPHMSIGRSKYFAQIWGARFYHLGDSGHINMASGFGAWPGGLQLAAQLLSPLRMPRFHPVETRAPQDHVPRAAHAS